jgi:hypothetical protein
MQNAARSDAVSGVFLSVTRTGSGFSIALLVPRSRRANPFL